MYYIQAIIDDIVQYYYYQTDNYNNIEFTTDINLAMKTPIYDTIKIIYRRIKEKIKENNLNIENIIIINFDNEEVAL